MHIRLNSTVNAYQAESWFEAKRIICKAEYSDKGAKTRFIIINLKHRKYRLIYETVYCGRGAMELMIKRHKNYLASDRTSCSSFYANQFRLLLPSIAYSLLYALRKRHLRHTEFAHAQFNTIRLRFFKIVARVRNLASRIKIHLPMAYPLQAEFEQIWHSCYVAGHL